MTRTGQPETARPTDIIPDEPRGGTMQPVARPLIVLHSDGVFKERVRKIGSQRFKLQFVNGWDELRVALNESPPAALVVVDPYTHSYGTEAELAPDLRSVLWEFPTATVIAALEVRKGRSRDLRTLGEWGVKEVIALDEEDTLESISRRLRSAQGRPLQSRWSARCRRRSPAAPARC
jgi:hypothetical protein